MWEKYKVAIIILLVVTAAIACYFIFKNKSDEQASKVAFAANSNLPLI